ncbi:MAG TPA: type II toxin-antitoxin system VapC family toxin [Gaiellaceae bacterium]
MLVVDASAVVDFLLASPAAQAVEQELDRAESLHAPHLIDLEIASALRRVVAERRIQAARGLDALRDLAQLSLTRYPAGPLLERIWQLRHTLTTYDAAYVALAELLEVPLLTTDERLARSHGHHAEIIVPLR